MDGGNAWQAVDKAAGEYIERSFANMYETGAMRWTHLRGRDVTRKRLLIHAGEFQLSLVFRDLSQAGTRWDCRAVNTIFSALSAAF